MTTFAERVRAIIVATHSGDPLTPLLQVLSRAYGRAMALRRAAYERGWVAARPLPCPVVSVGNITVGGTGKTPLTIDVARRLAAMGLRVAVLSRGYRGRAERHGAVVSDGRRLRIGPLEAGDEPWMMAQALRGIPVLVGHDRYRSGMIACRQMGAQAVVLDDGFQHWRLKRDLDLVVLSGHAPLGNGHLLPRGPLRETADALGRAHALVVTGGGDLPNGLAVMAKPLFRVQRRTVLRTVLPAGRTGIEFEPSDQRPPDLDRVRRARVFAFSGLADNDQFHNALLALSIPVAGAAAFPDHYLYNLSDLSKVGRAALKAGAGVLATTEKDLSRVAFPLSLPLAVFGLDIDFGAQAASFDRFLRQALLPENQLGLAKDRPR